jgi:hypothetical protein
MTEPLYRKIANAVQARQNCHKSGNTECFVEQGEHLLALVAEHMPSGSGFDNGTRLEDDLTPNRLVFRVAFHHMNEDGYYDGWTDHVVTVIPSLTSDFNLKISGRDRNDIKEHIGEVFDNALRAEIE